jgi:hypothetical protein
MFRFLRIVVIAFFVLVVSSKLNAAVTFTGDGNGENGQDVSASVTFVIDSVNSKLTIILRNTSDNRTLANGSVVTGVIFDFDPNLIGAMSFNPVDNPVETPGSNIYVHHSGNGPNEYVRIDNSASLGGSYTSNLSNPLLGDFGVATTGANSLFAAGPIGLGNGGPDYGLVAAGTFLGSMDGDIVQILPNSPNNLPFVQTSATFVFSFTGTLTDAQIVGARFLIGTNGANFVMDRLPPPPQSQGVPEPVSFFAWVAGFACCSAYGIRRKATSRAKCTA